MNTEREKLTLRLNECADIVGDAVRLSQETAIPHRTLATYLTGEAEPKTLRMAAIAKAARVSAHWLSTGEGPKLLSDAGISEQGNLYTIKQKQWSEFARIPLYNIEASAGNGSALENEEVKAGMAFRTEWLQSKGLQKDHLAIITAKGDSMEPSIKNGDILLINCIDTKVGEDAIYVIRHNGHLFAKRVQRMFTGELYIKSDNQAYTTQVIAADKATDLNIIGRVVWVGHEI